MSLAMSSPKLTEKDREGFPPKGATTFGEVVSTFNKSGNVAAKRHSFMSLAQHTRIPDNISTIHDKTVNIERDTLRSSLASRSRTPSPWSTGRPRSAPATPRSLPTPTSAMRGADNAGGNSVLEAPTAECGLGRGPGRWGYCSTTTAGTGATDRVGTEILGGNFSSAPAAAASSSGKAFAECPSPRSPMMRGHRRFPDPAPVQAEQASHRPPPLWAGAGIGLQGSGSGLGARARFGNRDVDSYCFESMEAGYVSEQRRFPAPQAPNPRVSSFVRLNGFLLRTHITSLIAALMEDGWLEAWEKERLCGQLREADAQPWAMSFLRIYMRFMETDDVPSFVAGLRAQIV